MKEKINHDEEPPILGTWKNIYVTVFFIHLALIILFYLFTKHFNQ